MIISSLKEIFKKEAILCIGSNSSHAIIEEKEADSKIEKITISDLDKEYLVIGLDEARNVNRNGKKSKIMSALFNVTDKCTHNKACDALIFREKHPNKLEVFYIELKSDKPTGFEEQFKSSMCFIKYIEAILKNLCNIDINIINESFTILHTDSTGKNKSINKSSTRWKHPKTNPKDPNKIIVKKIDKVSIKKIIK